MAISLRHLESELRERLFLSAGVAESEEERERGKAGTRRRGSYKGLLHLSDEVLVLVLRRLDPFSLLRVGSTCRSLFRVCSCNSLWTRHFQASFGVAFTAAECSVTAKDGFRLIFMWRTLYRSLHCNRPLQEKLFAEIPFPPHEYWTQWLVLEESVPLPSVRLARDQVLHLWGIEREALERKEDENGDEGDILKLEWKELYRLSLAHHGNEAKVFLHVLNRHEANDHEELETMFARYARCRFQWLFAYWMFRQPAPLDRQLRVVFLQWRRHSPRKVASWGGPRCDVRYLASLHRLTGDYWRGKLARGDENAGIRTVENYFSMCKSLAAWILGRDWGRLKRRKVYEDTLDGVYRLLKKEMQTEVIEHETFWHTAKVQMSRVCTLEETAANYVNWKMVETLPYYRLYMVSGNAVYLEHIRGFLRRKRLIHNWVYTEENHWVRLLLSEELYPLLEFDTKISQESLHGDSPVAQLSRLIWLYLNSGQQLYVEAAKGLVLQCARASLDRYATLLSDCLFFKM